MERKEYARLIFFIVVFFIFILTIILTCSVIFDNLDLLGMGTANQRPPIVLHLLYPPPSALYQDIIEQSPNNMSSLVTVNIALQFSGPLVEGTPVNVSAVGFVYGEGRETIKSISFFETNKNKVTFPHYAMFGFEGASVYNESDTNFDTPNAEFPIDLQENSDVLTLLRWDNEKPWPPYQSLKWDLQGDYYPILSITFNNETTVTTVYRDKKIHVSGSEIIRQERYAKISTWLAIAILVLTIVTSADLLFKLRPKFITDLLNKTKSSNNEKTEERIKELEHDNHNQANENKQNQHKKRR